MKSFLTSLIIFSFSFTLINPAPIYAIPDSKAPKTSTSTPKKDELELVTASKSKAVDDKLINGLAGAAAQVIYEASLKENTNPNSNGFWPPFKQPVNKFLLMHKIKTQLKTLITSIMLQDQKYYFTGIETLESRLEHLALQFTNDYYELAKSIANNEGPVVVKTKARQVITTLFEAYLASAIHFNENLSVSVEIQKYSKWIAIASAALFIPTQFEATIMPTTGSILITTSTLSYALYVYLNDKNNPYHAVEGLFRHPIHKLLSQNKSKLKDTLVTYFWRPVIDNLNSIKNQESDSETSTTLHLKAQAEEIKSLIESGKTASDFKILGYVIKNLQNEIKMSCIDLLTDI